MSASDVSSVLHDEEECDRELRGLWMSRLMFNPFAGWPSETRTFEEFHDACGCEVCHPEIHNEPVWS